MGQSGAHHDEEDAPATSTSLAEFHYQRVHTTFGFCMDDYRAECFWFEPVDLLRKLALSAMLQSVHRGTAAQCFVGSVISFTSFGVLQWLRPYREHESNVLKALVDTQLFLTFLISFILRVLPDINSSEPVGASFYGWLLVASMGLLVLAAVGLTVAQVCRRERFKAGLLSDTGDLGALTRGNSGQPIATAVVGGGATDTLMGIVLDAPCDGASASGQEETNEEPVLGPSSTATGLSRPASPSRDAPGRGSHDTTRV